MLPDQDPDALDFRTAWRNPRKGVPVDLLGISALSGKPLLEHGTDVWIPDGPILSGCKVLDLLPADELPEDPALGLDVVAGVALALSRFDRRENF